MTNPADRGDNSIWLNGQRIDPADATDPDSARRGPTAPAAQVLRVMSFALLAMPVLLGVVIAVSQEAGAKAATLPIVGGVVAALICLGATLAVGYRVPPLRAGEPDAHAQRAALDRFRTGFLLRFAFAEAPALIGCALTFATDPIAAVNYLPAGVLSLLFIVWHVVPNRWNVGRVQAALDQDGGRSQLLSQFGY
jgi:hypothetical protein